MRAASATAWIEAREQIDAVARTSDRTWADVSAHFAASPAVMKAIGAAGGCRAIADRDRYTASNLEREFREAYEHEASSQAMPQP